MGKSIFFVWTSQVALVAKNLPANVGDVRDAGSVPGLGRSPRGGHGNPLQYSCLENAMDRGAWEATVHGVAKSQAQLSTHTHTHTHTHTQHTVWAEHCENLKGLIFGLLEFLQSKHIGRYIYKFNIRVYHMDKIGRILPAL